MAFSHFDDRWSVFLGLPPHHKPNFLDTMVMFRVRHL